MYFGTAGVRGKIDKLTTELAMRLAYSFANQSPKGKEMLIARDCRMTSEIYSNAVKAGVMSAGFDVVDLGLASTPTAEFALHQGDYAGLIIITASHNPKEYNGLKFVDHKGLMLTKERGADIENNLKEVKIDELKQIKERKEDYKERHIKKILTTVKNKDKDIKVAIDYANCASATMAPLFNSIAKTTSINADIDGTFPGRAPEPRKENLLEFERFVKENADIGIAFDGDGDRTILLTKKGFVQGDVVFALALKRAYETKKGPVVTTVATSMLIKDVAEEYGQEVIETKVGGPYMLEAFVKYNARMAGEEVGAITWPEISLSKDGFMTAAQLIDMHKEKDIEERIEELPKYYNIKEKVIVSDKEKIMELLKQEIEDYIAIDGIKIKKDNEWALIRKSGTEDLLRVYAEAKTIEKAKELAEKYLSLIKKLEKEIR